MRHAILPRMSSYRVMHTGYIRTHVHTLNTIYVHMCTIPCDPHITVFYHFMQTNGLCTACSVLPCICHSICTVSHACIVCICHNNTNSRKERSQNDGKSHEAYHYQPRLWNIYILENRASVQGVCFSQLPRSPSSSKHITLMLSFLLTTYV